jgi:WD40 repeat protein
MDTEQEEKMTSTRFIGIGLLAAIAGVVMQSVAGEAPDGVSTMVPQAGHTQEVIQVLYAHRGDFVVTSASDRGIKFWTPDGRLLRTITTTDLAPRIALSPDDSMILTTGANGYLELWSVSGQRLRSFPQLDSRMLYAVAFAPDQSYVVGCTHASRNDYCQLFDLIGKPLARLDNPGQGKGSAVAVAVSPDGQTLYTAAHRSVIKWRRNGERIKEFPVTENFVSTMALSPDGSRLATASAFDARPRGKTGGGEELQTLISDNDGNRIARFKSHGTNSLQFSADSQWLVSGGIEDNRVLIHDRDGRSVRTLTIGKGRLASPAHLALSPDKRSFVMADHHFKPVALRVYGTDGALVRGFNQYATGIINMALDPTGHVMITTSNDNQIRYWGLDGRLLKRFPAEQDYPSLLAIAPNGRAFVTGDTEITVWGADGKRLVRAKAHAVGGRAAAFSPDGTTLYTGGADGYLNIIPLTANRKSLRVKPHDGKDVAAIAVHPDGKRIATGSIWDRFRILDLQGNVQASFEMPKDTRPPFSTVHAMQFTPDGKSLVVATTRQDREIAIYDMNARLLHTIASGNRHSPGALAISPSGRWLATTVNHDVGIWDLQTRQRRSLLRGHRGAVSALAFTGDERHVISASADGTVRVWNLENGQSFAVLSDRDEWVMYTDDGYFDASRHGGDLIALVRGQQTYAVDQIAMRYNRPDLIYERVNIGDREFREHFRNHYEERLRRAQMKTGATDTWSAPEVRVVDYRQDKRDLNLTVQASDAREPLRAIQVYVNDVPMYGGAGRPIEGRTARFTERVTLSAGKNKVEVGAINQLGIESLRAAVFAEYDARPAGDLYFVGMGVSQYRDPRLNLRFADADVTALASTLDRYRGSFRQVYNLQLTNARATRSALSEIRAFLAKAGVDDTVILLVSGHGAYDLNARATYYYLSHETDVKDLAGTSIAYDELEALLGGIQPRRKLMLMDTCASGEIDPAVLAQIQSAAGTSKLTARTSTPLLANNRVSRRTYLYARDRYIYNSLERRTGSIVFSSSLGEELSLESPELKNGVFTYALLWVLAEPKADVNRDGYLSMDELETAVKATVSTATRGLQHPTIDRDNIYQDFRLPVLRSVTGK